jgi:hypothetical protein
MMHYAKGVAHSALGDVSAAAAAQGLFRGAVQRVPKSRYLHNVPCVQLLAVAEEMLEGELSYRRGEHDAAFAHLRAAVALEDNLPYDEPWGWMQPVRHALGALLLEQNLTTEAEAIYREDLGLWRRAAPRADPPGQFVGAARVAGLPPAARRDCGSQVDPPARGLRGRACRSARGSVLLLRSRQSGLKPCLILPNRPCRGKSFGTPPGSSPGTKRHNCIAIAAMSIWRSKARQSPRSAQLCRPITVT